MSRIREALKKAAEERAAQMTGDTTEDLLDLLGTRSAEGIPAVSAPWPDQGASRERVHGLRTEFDELVAKCRRAEWRLEPKYSVFANGANNRRGAERFRTLRSRLYQLAAAQPLRRILLTSSIPREGKTFVACNLAQSISRHENRKVLLIDADLRVSCLHKALGATKEPGLSDYLRGDSELTGVIQIGSKTNLCFIPGGREISNPSEFLHSEKMKALLDQMAKVFDWIILDSPPAIPVHDASLLADMCDGALLVVRAGMTDFEVAQKAAAEFQNKKLLGVVLNRVEKSESHGEYYLGLGKE
jgi:protein-tyrosine kinase